jgi:enoyl-CoA hydratase/carnithine racemase
MPGEPLLIDRPLDGVLRLRLNRPERANALDAALVEDLHDAISDLDARAVVLGSSASRMFCGGADLGLADEERMRVSDRLYALYERMLTAPVPLVAAIDGAAVGGGAQLAVACDVRVVGLKARLRFVGPAHGLAVGAWALPSLVGRGRAMELCLSMRWVDAEEALEIGLADRRADDPGAEALALAGQIAGLDPAAVGRVKQVVGTASRHVAALAEEAEGNRDAWSGSVDGSNAAVPDAAAR